jgi:hypothetical protein
LRKFVAVPDEVFEPLDGIVQVGRRREINLLRLKFIEA